MAFVSLASRDIPVKNGNKKEDNDIVLDCFVTRLTAALQQCDLYGSDYRHLKYKTYLGNLLWLFCSPSSLSFTNSGILFTCALAHQLLQALSVHRHQHQLFQPTNKPIKYGALSASFRRRTDGHHPSCRRCPSNSSKDRPCDWRSYQTGAPQGHPRVCIRRVVQCLFCLHPLCRFSLGTP